MYRKLFKNDLRKNPVNFICLFAIMTFASTIAITVGLMLFQLFSSIHTMYKVSNPPHLLQMQKGEFKQSDIDMFNSQYDGITHYQSVPMIDFYGSDITLVQENKESITLKDCKLDISFVKQNKDYDVLLNELLLPIQINDGCVGVPVILLEQYDIQLGDTLIIKESNKSYSFIVTEFVYDAQMNSTLCSSTRFLISDNDFNEMFESAGETEYLIETYFTDKGMASDYQNAYESSYLNLPKNGQAVTYPVIFLLSAMTDLITALIYCFAGAVMVLLVFITLKFLLLEEIEKEQAEIGTMKAMGIPAKGIIRIYITKIKLIMAVSGIIGWILALLARPVMTKRITRTFGRFNMSIAMYFIAVVIAIAMYLLVVYMAKKVLNKLSKCNIVDLLVTENGFRKGKKVKSRIHKSKLLPFNSCVALQQVRHGYGMIFGLLFLATILVLLPVRIHSTMSNGNFVTYMGSAVCDGFLEVGQGEGLEERNEKASELINLEVMKGRITEYSVSQRVRVQVLTDNKELVGVFVDQGKTAGEGIQYLVGKQPDHNNQIALSILIADDLEKQVGDEINIIQGDKSINLVVCGIYQDVTSGGRTAKMKDSFADMEAEQYGYEFTINSGDEKSVIANMKENLGSGYQVEDMQEYIGQILGGINTQVNQASYLCILAGVMIVAFLTFLYMKLRIVRNQRELYTKKCMGIPRKDILCQELYPVLIAGITGIIVGIAFIELAGSKLVSVVFSMMNVGLTRITFVTMNIMQVLGVIILLSGVLAGTTLLAVRKINNKRVKAELADKSLYNKRFSMIRKKVSYD